MIQMQSKPETKTKNIEWLPAHIQPYVESNGDKIDIKVPEKFNLAIAAIDHSQGSNKKNETAFLLEKEGGVQAQLSYDQLFNQTNQFADLLQNLGFTAGERILLKMPNCLEYPLAFFATIKANCIASPISSMLTAKETDFIANDCDASAIVCTAGEWQGLKNQLSHKFKHVFLIDGGNGETQGHEIDFWAALQASSTAPHETVTNSDDAAYLVYTSGTTGNPKGVLHAQRSLLGRLPAALAWFNFQKPQRIMHTGKFNWTYVLGTAMMDPVFHGQTVIAYEGHNDASVWMNLVAKHECTTFIAVPTIYRQVLQKTEFNKNDVPTLQHAMSAGEKLSDQVLTEFYSRFGLYIHEGLGMSEVSYYISQSPYEELRAGATGKIQPGHKVKLINADGGETAAGDEGMIAISKQDPGIFIKYWNRPEEQAQHEKGDWFLTGDYAIQDSDGYIFFLGRRDDIINTFGFRVSPFEIEKVLKDHDNVADAVVVGQEISADKTLLVAVVIRHQAEKTTDEELLAFLKERVAAYKVPKKILFSDNFPRTRNGKVLRKALKEMVAASEIS